MGGLTKPLENLMKAKDLLHRKKMAKKAMNIKWAM